MKTIEEAAITSANKDPFGDINWNNTSEIDRLKEKHYQGFKAGVEFAQQWIPVEEEMPQKMQTEPIVSKVVQVKSKNFKEPFCAFYDHLHNIWIPYPFGSNSQILRITHWRPIELKL